VPAAGFSITGQPSTSFRTECRVFSAFSAGNSHAIFRWK
jgi:hypothetical protein